MNRTFIFSFAISLLCLNTELFARAGGGGGGFGGGGHFGGRHYGSYYGNGGGSVLLVLLVIAALLIYIAYEDRKLRNRKKEIQELLKQMAELEPDWSEESLVKFSSNQFFQIQKDWGHQDLNALSHNLSSDLFNNWKMQIEKQREKNERESFENLSIIEIFVVDVKNYTKDELDQFTVSIDAVGADKTLRDNEVISIKNSPFREYWTFGRSGKNWMLLEIDQTEGITKFMNSQLVYEKVISKRK